MANPPSRSCIVVDAPTEVQKWVDDLVAVSSSGTAPVWAGHSGGAPPLTVITLPALWRAVDKNFQTPTGAPWSVAAMGLPELPTVLPARDTPDPHRTNSDVHNTLHSILGAFHW